VINDLPRGGAETLLLTLTSRIATMYPFIECRVLTLQEKGSLARSFEEHGIAVDCLNSKPGHPLSRLFQTIRYVRQCKPDIVHTHLANGDRYGQLGAFVAGVHRRISTLHSAYPRQTLQELLIGGETGLLATDIVVVSQSSLAFWRARKMPARKLRVIYNCAGFDAPDADTRPRQLPASRALRLVCLGRLNALKGHIHAIRAMPEVIRHIPGCTLAIYGHDGGAGTCLQNEIRSLGIGESVFLRGQTGNPREALGGFDIMLSPSLTEGFGMAVVEGLSLGIPVIASRIPAHEEILANGEFGMLVQAGSHADLARAIISLAANPGLFAAFSAKGFGRAKDFSSERMIRTYGELYIRETRRAA
jgi:glycosyltransferase involved in cell wall biosynthesis